MRNISNLIFKRISDNLLSKIQSIDSFFASEKISQIIDKKIRTEVILKLYDIKKNIQESL